MHEYKPRGLVKWAPFAGLPEYGDGIRRLYQEMEKYEAEEVKEEQFYEYIDNLIKDIKFNYTIVSIDYIDHGLKKTYTGTINDMDRDYLYLPKIKIKKNNIINIT